MRYILSLCYLIFTSLGVVFIKLGGDSLKLTASNGLNFKIGWLTLLGLAFYLVSFLLWQKLLVTFNLSYIIPVLTGITQIIVLIVGALIFKENVNIYNIIGVITIIIGVILIAVKGK